MLRRLFLAALVLTASPAFATDSPVKLEATEGTELSKEDDAAVRKTLLGYLEALRKKEYAKAGELIERASLLATVEPLVNSIAADSTHTDAARKRIFGVSTRDSISASSNGVLFESLLHYLFEINPNAPKVLERSTIQVLAPRQMKGQASVAYQLTVAADEPGGMPYEQVTAQQLKKVDGKWRILFRLE